ncbi:IgGFc-binding protein-like [Rhinophrynus dorsalis]
MQNAFSQLSQQKYEFRVTGHHDNTSVKVTVFGGAYSRNFSIGSRKTISVQLPISVEIRGILTFNNTVFIKSDKPITVLALNAKFHSAETTIVYPLTSLGTDYYLITPKDGISGSFKVFSILASKEQTTADISLKGSVHFQGQTYPANSILTVSLAPLQGVQLLSPDDLSGSRVMSQKPVAVLSGHTCTWKNNECNLAYEQLLPVPQWGKIFFVPPFSLQTRSDFVYVVAADKTQIKYTFGDTEKSVNLVAGQVEQIEITNLALRITASTGVQVTFYSTGGRTRRFEYSPMLMNILNTGSYCTSYYIYGQRDTDNYAIIIAKNSSINEITFDELPLQNPKWKQIQGTEYLWYEYNFGMSFTTHLVEHPNTSFGLQSVGIGALFSYGSPATCVKEIPTCSSTTCPPRQECVMDKEKPKCIRQKVDVCSATGDLHFRTFDGLHYNFMGTCTYTLISVRGDVAKDLLKFTVLARNENRGKLSVSCVGQVTFQTNNYTIDVKKGEVGFVRVNSVRLLVPVTLMNGTLKIFQSGNSLFIQLGNDVQVSYDWNHVFRGELTRRYAQGVCGMCGNYNQNPADDFITPDGTQAPDVISFGKSWKVKDNSICWDDCHGPCLKCPPNISQKYTTDAYCGLIRKADGPFQECHSILDPVIHLESCVFDVCLNGGYKQMSCDALKAYASACQREGVNISQWREAAGCPFSCPRNSTYNACGRACPATCQDPNASSDCTEPCTETCECDPGFVLIEGKCQTRSNCGCLFEGRSYSPNEMFWRDTACKQRCVCNGRSQNVDCKAGSCRVGEECTVKNGLQDCYPTTFGTCTAYGTLHYNSYDGLGYDFQRTCQYQLSALCDHTLGLTDFQVFVRNQNQGKISVSYTTVVIIKVNGKELQLSRQHIGKVMIDGSLRHLPYSSNDGQLFLFYNPSSVVIKTNFLLTVTYDLSSIVTVTIPGTYAGAVCGLCGNFNKNRKDDLIPKGESTPTTAIIFARSWKVGEIKGCVDGPNPICPGQEEQEKIQRSTANECGILLGRQGPFRDCHNLVDPEEYFQSCVYDRCLLQQRQEIYCSALASYSLACQVAGGRVYPWRSEELCSYSCPHHSHYELCASGCPVTCKMLTSPPGCDSSCREGCVCDDEFVLSGKECVPLSQCGCVDGDGEAYYPVGEMIYVGERCEKRCTCSLGGNMICSPSSCSKYEECRIEKGVRDCYPVGSATCTIFTDSHYRTFDGQAYDFRGLCSYVLAQSCGENVSKNERNLTQFTVITQKEKFGSSAAVVNKVTVVLYGQKLTLIQKRRGVVQINGVDHRLPATLLSGKIRVECYGQGILITNDLGLKVAYDLLYHVSITIPSNYKERTCGLCGNYDGKAENDLALTSGDIIAFGEMWKTPESEKDCKVSCGVTDNPCPSCDGLKKEIFSQYNYCGILFATSGPFFKCHPIVDPASYVTDCLSDLCQANGDITFLCSSVAVYAAACKNANVTDIQWRSDGFCGMKCHPHSHYNPCAELCSSSCASLTDTYICPDTCDECCECDEGYIFDGTSCIQLKECGCFQNGQYYKPNETRLNDDCSSSCICNPVSGLSCSNNSCAADENCETEDGVRRCINIDPCKSKNCRLKETCQVQDGRAVCVPNYSSTCWAWGDLHFNTLDSHKFDFQGTCSYILAKYTGEDTSLMPFQVVAKNNNRGNQAVSFVRLVQINVYGENLAIQTEDFGKIRVNGVLTNLPVSLQDGKLKVSHSGLTVIVETDFNFTVTYDWNWHVSLTIPSSYYNAVSGLCGNFNENPNDDQRAPNNTQIPNIIKWAGTWKVYDQDPFCWDYCPGDCPTCEESKKLEYGGEKFCGLIFKADGPFRECTTKFTPNTFFYNCLFDVCMNDGAKVILCQALETYASICMNQGVKIYDWRTPSNCPKICGKNSHYEACGNACPANCFERNAPVQCKRPCIETCQCNESFVLSVDKCVPISDCGCQYNGQYYQPNQEFWSDIKCNEHCKCDTSLGMVICHQTSCKSSEVCTVVNGKLGCYPTKYTTCIASGDRHYKTYDGKRFDFMGTCIYQLVAVTSNDSTLTHFTVNIQKENRGNKAVSYTKDVILEVHNQTIIMSKDFPHKLKVNGILTELPYSYDKGKISAFTRGMQVFIQMDSEIVVTFDGNSYARVIMPSTYAGAVNGLCGNNNGDPSDDFTIGDNKITSNDVEFGNYWMVRETPGCLKEPPAITKCTSMQIEGYKSVQYCGLISKSDGPFSLCHTAVDPVQYFEDCLFDACQYKGHQSSVCSNIASYVSECQSKGIEIKEWRSTSFCSAVCSQNSHYELCGNGCPSTCYGLSSPGSCVASCTEGCYCDNGFLLSGKDCVSIAQCGCLFNETYYKEGDEFFTDRLCQRQCKCGKNSRIICQDHTCGINEECKVVNGIQGCHAKDVGQCTASGNLHYLTFDGVMYDFQGTCTYTLVKVNGSNNFSVTVNNEPYERGIVAVTKSVSVYIEGLNIHLEKDSLLVNGERNYLPYQSNDGKVWINQEGINVIVQSMVGLTVLFDCVSLVLVSVPSSFSGSTQGLCGNFNNDFSDDFHFPNGSTAKDPAVFGAFWAVAGDGSNCQGRFEGKCLFCDPNGKTEVESPSKCGLIADTHGPFSACHALVPLEKHVCNCAHDICISHDEKEALCMNLQVYALECQNKGVLPGAWRNSTNCTLTCPANSHYEPCTRTCTFTCSGIIAASTCTEKCFEGCECDFGFVFDGDRCVSLDKCGCNYKGRYLKANESVISEDCRKHCTCKDGSVSCTQFNCMESEICQLRDGLRGCYSREAQCNINNGQHFTTFDGVSGAYPVGAFIMASSCNASTNGQFLVTVHRSQCSKGSTMTLHVFTSQGLITVNGIWESWLNGRPLLIKSIGQHDIGDGSVKFTVSGYDLKIEIVGHITIVWGKANEITLIAKENMAGKTCGACGNFNGIASDDLRLMNDEPADSITSVIRSWTAKYFSTCSE